MAGALMQSVTLPGAVTGNRIRLRSSEKSRRTIKMISTSSQTSSPAYLALTELRRSNSSAFPGFTGLERSRRLMLKPKQDFFSVVASSVSAPRGKASRGAAVAMFERFDEKAIKVLILAQEEARRSAHNRVGTEQILLGLFGEGTGTAAKVLKSAGINLIDVRIEVEKIIGMGSGFDAVEIPYTPRAKRVLELSLEEATQLGHRYIGSEHLLLGLLRVGEGVAARALQNLGADPSNIRTQVIRTAGEGAEQRNK